MNIEDAFGVPIGVHELTTLDCESAIKHVEGLTLEELPDDATYGAYTETVQLLEDNFFKELKAEVREATLSYSHGIGHRVEDINITTSWANITEDNKSIAKHVHANSYTSGVIYLNQGSDINFHNVINMKDMFTLTPLIEFDANNRYTWESIAVAPQPKMLIVFPSGLHHSVSNSPTRRHSIAYNTMPLGPVGGGFSKIITRT